MNGKWTQEEILKAMEEMKERFLQNADYLFCNPADYAELKNLMGERLNVRSNAGVDPGKIILVDHSAVEPWWDPGFEEDCGVLEEGGTNCETRRNDI